MKKLIIIILSLFLCGQAFGATIHVNSACSAGCDGTTSEKGWATIAPAVVASSTNDTIEVTRGSGPYYERVTTIATRDNITWNFNDAEVRNDYDLNILVEAGTHKWVKSQNVGNTDEYFFVKLGTQQMTNGDMEVDTGFSCGNCDTNELVASPVYEGTYSRHIASADASVPILYQAKALTANTPYIIDTRIMGDGSATVYVNIQAQDGDPYIAAYDAGVLPAGVWTHVKISTIPTTTENYLIKIYTAAGSCDLWVDNYYFYEAQDPWGDLFRNGQTQIDSCVVGGDWKSQTQSLNGGFPDPKDDGENHWAWDDADSLGYSTLYTYLADATDPTGQDVEILAPLDPYGLVILEGTTGHVFNDMNLIGANSLLVYSYDGALFNNNKFKYANNYGFHLANDGTTQIKFSEFIDSGHDALHIPNDKSPTLELYNNDFSGCHLVLLKEDTGNNDTPTVTVQNNASYKLFAGVFDWRSENGTLTEDHNQWHIDFNSPHGGKKFDFGSRGFWTTTAATDIPASFNTSSDCSALEANCGTDPLFVSATDYNLKPGSPCIKTGYNWGCVNCTDGNNNEVTDGSGNAKPRFGSKYSIGNKFPKQMGNVGW